MSLVTVNGIDALSGAISIPRVGCWHAELEVVTGDLDGLTGPVTITIDGADTFQGATIRAETFADSVKLRVVGGTGGLWKTALAPKGYRIAPNGTLALGTVLRDIVTAAGETLAASTDAGLLNVQLAGWTILQQAAGAALLSLFKTQPSATWRMLPSGELWAGYETWPSVELDGVVTHLDGAQGRLEIGTERLALSPGTVLQGKRITSVSHVFSPDDIRTVAHWEGA